jgi:GTPase SAR1 family protein
MTNPVVLMVGLDQAGKTKILYTLKLGEVTDEKFREVNFDPTAAFNFEVVPWMYKKIRFNLKIWDLAGRAPLRPMWKHFYEIPPDVLFFVVDDSEEGRKRIDEARDAFQQLLHDPKLLDTIKVVLVNIRDETQRNKQVTEEVEERTRFALGLNDGHPISAIARKVKIFGVRLGKSQKEDENLFNAVNYVCFKCLEQNSSSQRVSKSKAA